MSSDAITPDPLPEPAPTEVTPEPAAESAPPPPHFEVLPYQPDGSAPPSALAMTLAGVLVSAAAIGFVVSIIHQWFYLVLLFPIFMGLALGGVGMALIRVGKLRNPLLAGVAAGLGGIMLMGSMHYFDYQRALDKAAEQIGKPRAVLEENTSFFEFIDARAEAGVRIGRTGHKGDGGMNLGHVGSYIYWLVEMIIVAVIAWSMMQSAASAPFCVGCNLWKQKRPIAMIEVPEERLAVQAVQEGDVVRLMECAGPVREVGLLLETAVCPGCVDAGEVDVSLERVTKNEKNQKQTTTVVRVTYPGEVLPFLDGSVPAP